MHHTFVSVYLVVSQDDEFTFCIWSINTVRHCHIWHPMLKRTVWSSITPFLYCSMFQPIINTFETFRLSFKVTTPKHARFLLIQVDCISISIIFVVQHINSSQPTMAPSNNSRRASLSIASTPLSHYGSMDENCKIEKLVNIPSKVSKYFYVCCKILRWYIIKWGNSGIKSISSASLTLFHITNIFYSCHTVCGR